MRSTLHSYVRHGPVGPTMQMRSYVWTDALYETLFFWLCDDSCLLFPSLVSDSMKDLVLSQEAYILLKLVAMDSRALAYSCSDKSVRNGLACVSKGKTGVAIPNHLNLPRQVSYSRTVRSK
jgi:hypothetical protein